MDLKPLDQRNVTSDVAVKILKKHNTNITAEEAKIILEFMYTFVKFDQNLDLQIPESRRMLAVYISMPEAENFRSGMNIVVGIRRARLERRCMGTAPAGYMNKINTNKINLLKG